MIWFLLHPPASSVTTPHLILNLCSSFTKLPVPQTGHAFSCLPALPNSVSFAWNTPHSNLQLHSPQVPAHTSLPPGSLPRCSRAPVWGRRLRCVPSALWSPLSTLRWSHSLAMTGNITDLCHGRKAHQALPVWVTPASSMKHSVCHTDGVQEIVAKLDFDYKRNVTPL